MSISAHKFKPAMLVLVLSLLLPVIALALLSGVLAGPGAVRGVRPLSNLDAGLPGIPVVPISSGAFGYEKYATAVIKTASPVMAEASEIAMKVGSFGASIAFTEFSIVDSASGTLLFAADAGTHEDNAGILLRRKALTPVSGTGVRTYEIRAKFRGGDKFAIWTQMPARTEQVEQTGLFLTSGSAEGFIWGTWRSGRTVAPLSRWEMLRYVWDDRPVVPSLVVVSLLVLLAAGICFFTVFLSVQESSARARLGVLLTGISVTLAYVVFCPPFHAPDEPDHFLTMTTVAGVSGLEASALSLARKGYLEAIKFRPNVPFAAEFVGDPDPSGWAKHIAETGDQQVRSPVAARLWPALGRILGDLPAADALVILRLINSLLFFLAFAVFLRAVPRAHQDTLGLLLLTMPALPFFAMHWSNHSMAVAGIVASSGLVVRLVLGGSLPLAVIALWGAMCGLSFVSGVTGIAVLFFSGAAVLVAVLARESPRFILFAGLLFSGSALAVISALAPAGYFDLIVRRIVRVYPPTGFWLHAGNLMVLVVSVTTICVALTSCFRWIILRYKMALRTTLKGWGLERTGVLWSCVRVEALIWACFFLIPVWPHLELQDIESPASPPIEIWKYGLKAVATFFSGFGLGRGDFLTSASFWGGFGWLDAMPSAIVVQSVKVIPSVGICLVLIHAIRGKELRSWAWLHYVTVLVGICVFCFAAASFQIPANLHGRYLVGPFVLLAAVCGIGISETIVRLGETERKASRQLMFVAVVSLHAICIRHLVLRYFGGPS